MIAMKRLCLILILGLLPLSGSAVTEFEKVLNSYGKLRTAAGRGWIRTKGVNGWTEVMEGGSALEAELSRPHMTMADSEGNLYIADKDAHAIRKVTTDGRIHTIAGTGVAGFNGDGLGVETQLSEPNGLYTFPDGTTYILDMGNGRIRKLSTDGQVTTIVHDPDGILVGRGLWVSGDETTVFYASMSISGVVKKWTAAQGLTLYASGFTQLGDMDVDPGDGNLVVTDRGANQVYRVFPDGSREAIAGNGSSTGGGDGQKALETALYGVRGICFAPNGGYFVATHEGGQVWYVDTDGYVHLVIDGDDEHTHAGDGEDIQTPGKKISEPRAVELAPNGDLLVTENDYGYVRVVEKVLRVLEMDVTGEGAFSISWSSVPGKDYIVEFKDDLLDGTWDNAGNVPANETDVITSFSEPLTAGDTSGFYRVRRSD
jgi:hypothetical protein